MSASSTCSRGLIISNKEVKLCSTTSSLPPLILSSESWTLVAVSYDQINKEASIYVGGEHYSSFNISNLPNLGTLTVGGHPGSFNGFHGHVDNLFVYSDVLSKEELNFMFYSVPVDIYPIARSSGSALKLDKNHGAIISSGMDRFTSFTQISISLWIQTEIPVVSEFVLLRKGCSENDKLEFQLSLVDDTVSNQRKLRVYFMNDFYWSTVIMPLTTEWWHLYLTWDGVFVSSTPVSCRRSSW